jgi:hypothetical protein
MSVNPKERDFISYYLHLGFLRTLSYLFELASSFFIRTSSIICIDPFVTTQKFTHHCYGCQYYNIQRTLKLYHIYHIQQISRIGFVRQNLTLNEYSSVWW